MQRVTWPRALKAESAGSGRRKVGRKYGRYKRQKVVVCSGSRHSGMAWHGFTEVW